MTYADAVQNLVRAGARAGVPITISPSGIVDQSIFGVLSDDIAAVGYPESAELPWMVEELYLYPLNEVPERQAGYRTDARTGATSPDWDQSRYVLADWAANPISIGTDGSIAYSRHGLGSWSYMRIAPDLPTFLDLLAAWLRYFVVERGERLFDENYEISEQIRKEIEERVLSATAPEDRRAALSFLLGEF